tara:strand:- start:279 stop:674 length:396 start_codon:yes stop_codon:yes gene_type:complete
MTRPASSFSALFTTFIRSHELTADIRGAWHESSDPFTALHTSSQLSDHPPPQYQRVTEATQSEINPEGADPDTAPLPSHFVHGNCPVGLQYPVLHMHAVIAVEPMGLVVSAGHAAHKMLFAGHVAVVDTFL